MTPTLVAVLIIAAAFALIGCVVWLDRSDRPHDLPPPKPE